MIYFPFNCKKQISNLEKQLKTENDILLYSRLKDKLNIEYIKIYFQIRSCLLP